MDNLQTFKNTLALVVGNATEWGRIIKVLYEYYLKHGKIHYHNYMRALLDMQHHEQSVIYENYMNVIDMH